MSYMPPYHTVNDRFYNQRPYTASTVPVLIILYRELWRLVVTRHFSSLVRNAFSTFAAVLLTDFRNNILYYCTCTAVLCHQYTYEKLELIHKCSLKIVANNKPSTYIFLTWMRIKKCSINNNINNYRWN